jgi:putative ABC transport system permease protein
MEKTPPEYARRFLQWFCPPQLYEGIEGDLRQQFEEDISVAGAARARRYFVWNVLLFFRPAILLRNRFSFRLIDTIMLSNYFTIAYRNVLKNKVFSAINIFGLAIGLAACLFIFQFVSFELSYDTFHEKFERTYRVTNDRFQHGKLIQHGTIMYPTIGPTMAKDYPEIETYTRLMPGGDMNLKLEDKFFKGDQCHFADEYFFSVFSFGFLAGDRNTALKTRYTMVITRSMADKLFGIKDNDYRSVIGKTLYWGNDQTPYKVTGVCTDIPENSHIQFDALVSYATLIWPQDQGADNSWTWSDMRHYLVLKPGADYKALEAKFDDFSERYFQGDKVSGSIEKFYLQPLKEAHLYSDYEYDIAKVASGKAVWAMLIVAGFILLIAWINYINLTTSRALERAKEVGLRKVMGAVKTQLIRQFILESVLTSFVALVIALLLVLLLQKSFNELVDGNLSCSTLFSYLSTDSLIIVIALLVIGILLSGFYPAFVLSSYQPVTVLKGKFQRSSRGNYLRKGLVIFQFMASAALITGTLIVGKQLKFMNDAELGINIHDTMILQAPELMTWDSTTIERIENFKYELTQIDGVVHATTSNSIPGERLPRTFDARLSDQPSDSKYTLSVMNVDHHFLDTYDVPLVAGRKFVASDHKYNFQDIKAIILNLNAVKLLGIPNAESAIGREVVWGNNGTRLWTIVGVVRDYHQESLKNPMEPLVFRPTYSTGHRISVRMHSGSKEKAITAVENVYKRFFPANAFQYSFLEDRYKSQYKDDNRFGKVIGIFTMLGIIISCLGLIGLSSYTAYQRTKEIGIRKVLGASLTSILSLLSFDFLKLVLIATLLAMPVAYFAMKDWLAGYAYKISLEAVLFITPILMILAIAAVTMSFYVIKTARTNPADTLKYE